MVFWNSFVRKARLMSTANHSASSSRTRIYPKIPSNLVRKAVSKLYDYLSHTREVHEIYSCRGIFEIDSSKVYRVTHTDGPTEQITLHDVNMIVDKSVICKILEFQFPRSHSSRTVVRSTYKFSKKSTVQFVVESCDDPDDLYWDYYFVTDNYNQSNHQMDMIEFLNMIIG